MQLTPLCQEDYCVKCICYWAASTNSSDTEIFALRPNILFWSITWVKLHRSPIYKLHNEYTNRGQGFQKSGSVAWYCACAMVCSSYCYSSASRDRIVVGCSKVVEGLITRRIMPDKLSKGRISDSHVKAMAQDSATTAIFPFFGCSHNRRSTSSTP